MRTLISIPGLVFNSLNAAWQHKCLQAPILYLTVISLLCMVYVAFWCRVMSNQAIREKHISKHYHVYAAGLSLMWAKYSSCWLQQQTNCLFYSFISALWTWRELKIVQSQMSGQKHHSVFLSRYSLRQNNEKGWEKLGMLKMLQIGKSFLQLAQG